MIEQLDITKLLTSPGRPTLLTNMRAVLDCGCCAYLGLRADTHEAAIASRPCNAGHEHLVRYFELLYRESLVEPSGRPAIDVADELLDQAAGIALAGGG